MLKAFLREFEGTEKYPIERISRDQMNSLSGG
jgi:hypothetical protein